MAEAEEPQSNLDKQESESLESPKSIKPTESTSGQNGDNSLEMASSPSEITPPERKKKLNPFQKVRQFINIYLLLLGAVLIMAGIIIAIAYEQNRNSSPSNNVKTQTLSQSTLNQLANSDSTVGSSQYVLNVESSAIFAGQVVLRQSLEVAGDLQVGGTGSFNVVNVAGAGQFGQATINNNLTVGGNTAVQGSATIAKSLQVSSGGTFGGSLSAPQITTSSLQLNGDLILQHHIDTSGPTPSRSDGSALGSGGSVSISGTDDAGSININTGNTPPAGCFVTVNFATPYKDTPHVLVTPIGSAAGGLSYYVNRLATSFSVCDASIPPAGSSFGFDYFVID
jgi:cytoskeletal protein CcmA (bactofilin family)